MLAVSTPGRITYYRPRSGHCHFCRRLVKIARAEFAPPICKADGDAPAARR